jgi:hypothetical protein
VVLVSRLALRDPAFAFLLRVAAHERLVVVGRRAAALLAAAGSRLGRVGFAKGTAARVGGIARFAFPSPRLLSLRGAPTLRRVVLVSSSSMRRPVRGSTTPPGGAMSAPPAVRCVAV